MRMSDTQLPPGRILPNYGPNQAVKGRLEPRWSLYEIKSLAYMDLNISGADKFNWAQTDWNMYIRLKLIGGRMTLYSIEAFINHICFDFYFVHKHIFCLLGSLVQVSQVASSLSPNCLNCQFFWIEIDRTCESFNEKGEVLQTNFRDRVVLKLG